ncbi:MAG: VWA domain-containing protein [Gemmatimonadetes bacterium]|nr:VWA domain-containing protein [Gemmatimonadota bacterium]
MFRRLLLSTALAVGSAGVLHAQGWIEIERPIRPGIVSGSVVRISSNVRTRIEGRVASVEVEEQFRNTGGWIAEGTYLYPMPGEAVFQNFSLWMGENEVRGEMMNAEQARGIYEEIVRRLRDPALLTLEGHGLIRARVFPIQPGETRRVVLRYTQLLQRSGDALRMRYAIGSRDAGSGRGLLNEPDGLRDNFRFRVTVPDADAYGTPYSPTHGITSRRSGDELLITLDSNATGDVELFIPVRRGLVGTSLVAHAPGGEDGYFMLLVSPPQAEDGVALPRDLTLVVDVSGSMSGDKMEQAKAALRQAIGTLRPADRFRLISFSNRVVNFRDGFAPATPENVAAARTFVDQLVADGGTNIAGALDAALGATVAEERLPIVVFVTDGIPSVGEQAPERIAQTAGGRIGRARIFTVGVGSDVNTYLLDRLATEGRGTAEYVAPDADVETAMGSLLGKIAHPALTNLRIEGAPVELVQTYPSRLPDVFYGEELAIFGRFRGQANGHLTVVGQRNGRTERFTTDAAFPVSETDNAFIPRLWASRRIGELTRQIRIEGATPALVQEVRDLGLRYGILTEYTSYLVQEPVPIGRPMRPDVMPNQAPSAMPAELRGGAGAAGLQTGREAFERARASASMMGARSLAAADAAADTRLGELTEGYSGARRSVRRVGGKLFVRIGNVWTDAAHQDSLRVVEVAPFSEAYFQLVRALPQLAPYLGIGDEVLIAGRRASVKLTATGATTWRPGHLDAVVRAFRGA